MRSVFLAGVVWLRRLRFAAIVMLAIAGLVAGWKYTDDNRFLREWSATYVDPDDSPSEKTTKLLDGFRPLAPGSTREVDARNLGLFGTLSTTPREVIELGGACENKSRLMRSLLHLEGIDSTRVILLDADGKWNHTVTEVEIEGGRRMIVDPLYGLHFPKPEGGYYSLAELQQESDEILKQRVDALAALDPPAAPPYHANVSIYSERVSYQYPIITLTWKRDSLIRWAAYAAVVTVMGAEWMDSTSRPYFMERPALIVLLIVLCLEFALVSTYLPGLILREFRGSALGAPLPRTGAR